MVERHQRGGGVGTAATQPAAHGQMLGDADRRTLVGSCDLSQQQGGAHRQISRRRHAGNFAGPLDQPVVARLEPQPVAAIQELKHGLQQVVAVRPPADDPQHEVEFGRGGPGITPLALWERGRG